MGFCSLPPDRVKLAVNSKKKQTAGSKWAKSQNGPRVKMGFCYLPLKRVKMCCCCLPLDRVKLTEQQERNKGQGQIGPKGVKLGLATEQTYDFVGLMLKLLFSTVP